MKRNPLHTHTHIYIYTNKTVRSPVHPFINGKRYEMQGKTNIVVGLVVTTISVEMKVKTRYGRSISMKK